MSPKQLARDLLRDFVSDMRWAKKQDVAYLKKVRKEFQLFWPTRHNPKFDEFGWPVVLAEFSTFKEGTP